MATDGQASEIDTVTSNACETSMVVAGLFEKRDPSAVSAYNNFYSLAMRALDLHQAQLAEMKASRANFLDQVSLKLMEMQTMNEEVERLEEQCTAVARTVASLREELKIANERNQLLSKKLTRHTALNEELAATAKSCDDLRPQIPDVEAQIAFEKARQAQLTADIEKEQQTLIEGNPTIRQKLKKNQMKAIELEAKIKRASTAAAAAVEPPPPPPPPREVKPKEGPSLIIHRTQDADADEVRMLRSAMEEAIKQNSLIKTQITNLEQDLAAMHEENVALKALTRTIIGTKK
jgi:chromosome segregation ATPase